MARDVPRAGDLRLIRPKEQSPVPGILTVVPEAQQCQIPLKNRYEPERTNSAGRQAARQGRRALASCRERLE
jgi:hypothetical protein